MRRLVERTACVAALIVSGAGASEAQGAAANADSAVHVHRHYTKQNAIAFSTLGVLSFGVIWILPEEISKWPRNERQLNHLLDAYRTPPVWDHDPWVWNYVIHPVAGAYAYDAERNHDEGPMRSFLFSTATSVAWEYGFEAWIEHPSAQDLLITSTTGSVLGELSYRATRRMARNGFNPLEKVALVVINPVWILQRGFRTRDR
jgi:hypothetical protein